MSQDPRRNDFRTFSVGYLWGITLGLAVGVIAGYVMAGM